MRNYKKYRQLVIYLFQSFLAEKMKKTELIEELTNLELDLKSNRKTLKSLWLRFFEGDTGATDIQNIYYGIGNPTNDKFYRECMQIAIENPKGLQIYYS
jgi:hypothetical protein